MILCTTENYRIEDTMIFFRDFLTFSKDNQLQPSKNYRIEDTMIFFRDVLTFSKDNQLQPSKN